MTTWNLLRVWPALIASPEVTGPPQKTHYIYSVLEQQDTAVRIHLDLCGTLRIDARISVGILAGVSLKIDIETLTALDSGALVGAKLRIVRFERSEAKVAVGRAGFVEISKSTGVS